ncbi:hypothetical protein [Stenotrophomonas maltophilia]|jgi:hypothetical protein|uniref:hypothetical protein n=1 Tax=Stenotrophomonas maltophilia TaxID=40324 RepID=UPI00021E0DFE|nr:hypothetical protein [Stenotrophomonas maltophilia]AEM50624.1 hypothetical protein BurJV3_1292 [Stenotrophomonas maltophilia JV3]
MSAPHRVARILLPSEEANGARIGGNLPQCLEGLTELEGYSFYATFENPNDSSQFISVCVPESFDDLLRANIYPDCCVKVFQHPPSMEGAGAGHALPGYQRARIGSYEFVEAQFFEFLTCSKEPLLLQEEPYYETALLRDGFRFLMQMDEFYYPDGLIEGNVVFGFGGLYLYAHESTGEVIAGFWQYS